MNHKTNNSFSSNKKGQMSLEYLVTYGWVFIVLLVMIGAMFYMDLFDTTKYAAQYCIFDSNIYCSDYTIRTQDSQNFDVSLSLQNNMNKEIIIDNIKMYDDNYKLLTCKSTAIYCPLFENESYGFSNPSNGVMLIDTNKSWTPTRLCSVTIKNCTASVVGNYKQKLNFNITFRGEDGSVNHSTIGTLYANIEQVSESAATHTDSCDLANFNFDHKLVIQNNEGKNLTMIDGNGMILIKGEVFQNYYSGSDDDDFKIRNKDNDVIAWVSNPQGGLYLNGELKQNSEEEPKIGEHEFIIQNSVGGTIAFFDESGNLYIKNCIKNVA